MSGTGLLWGKAAVVTGGTPGPARASARRFAARGARVLGPTIDTDRFKGFAPRQTPIDFYRLHDRISGGAP